MTSLLVFASAELLTSSALYAAAAAALGWALVSARPRLAMLAGAEAERRAELKKNDFIVRAAEPWFEALAEKNAKWFKGSLAEMQRQLDLVFPGRWTSAEFLAASQLQGVGLALAIFTLGLIIGEFSSVAIFGLFVGLIFPYLQKNALKKKASRRKSQVRARLPFVLDLTALMMESGALFTACIQTVVQETGKHAIAEELSRVLASLRQGIPRAAALKEFSKRLDDHDVDEVVFAVNTSEELGTPLDKTLRSMADRMRQRRIQELERQAEQAKVHITWPAMLVMVACLLVVASPIMLGAG